MQKPGIRLSAILLITGLSGLAIAGSLRHERQDLYAKWGIEINKNKSSRNQYSQLSRDFEAEYFNKDFPAFFHSSSSNKYARADVSCRFSKETTRSIFHECLAKANVDAHITYDKLEAWMYRISIPGYERNESRLLARLIADHPETPTQDFIDPINHSEQGSPEAQKILVPITSISTGFNFKNQRFFDLSNSTANQVLGEMDRGGFNLLLLGSGLTAVFAIVYRRQRSKTSIASIVLASLAMLELASAMAFHNPMPRNQLIKDWRIIDVIDNIHLGLLYQRWTNGLSGEKLVKHVWTKANLNSDSLPSAKMIEEIHPKQSGLLFSQDCSKQSVAGIDLLIVGASVAEGWHASSLSKTLWNIASQKLNQDRVSPLCIAVKARAGIHSDTELEFVRDFLGKHNPKAIVLIHSQNDIINPTFNVTSKPMGVGKEFNSQLLESAEKFLAYSSEIRRLASKQSIHVFEFMPPSALDKQPLTNEERTILVGYASHKSYDWTLPSRLLNSTFNRIASSLQLIDRVNGEYTFIDGRRAFEGEKKTMFADIWHFGDLGHEKFGVLIADIVSFWIENQPSQY